MRVLNWCYGIRSVDVEQQVKDAIYAAHKYRNRLCELELEKRKRHYELLRRLVPQFVEAEERVREEESKLAEVREAIQSEKVKQRTKKPKGVTSLIKQASESKAKLKELYALLKKEKQDSYNSPEVQDAIEQNNRQHKVDCKDAKEQSGLYWGTEAIIRAGCSKFGSGAPPEFKRFRGEGQLAVQLQGGLKCDRAHRSNTLVYFGETAGKVTDMYFRVASTEKGKPVFAKCKVVLHRPLPDGTIKWAYLERRMLADKAHYKLRITVEVPDGVEVDAINTESIVAVHTGWSVKASGLVVAYARGPKDATIELVLPKSHTADYQRLDAIKSDRSMQLEAIKAFLKSMPAENLPEWLLESQKHCHAWKSPERALRLLWNWRANRFDSDSTLIETPTDAVGFSRISKPAGRFAAKSEYHGDVRRSNHHAVIDANWNLYDVLSPSDEARLEAVVRGEKPLMSVFECFERLVLRDKHLWQFEARLSKRIVQRRKDIYRNFAQRLSQLYDVAIVAPIDAKELTENLPPESLEADKSEVHRHAKWAAVSDLVQCIREKFHLRTIDVKSAGITVICANCGHVNQNNDLRRIQCSGCSITYGKEENALDNMLARGRGAIKTGALLALFEKQEKESLSKKEKLAKMQEANRAKRGSRK